MFKLKILYLLFYFAFGGSLGYFSRYFSILGIDGKISGSIFALGSLATVISQPILGILADKSKRSDRLIRGLFILLIIGLYVIFIDGNLKLIFLGFLLYCIASWGIMPLLDGIVLGAHYPFGEIRLFGSLGFALGSLVSGKLIDIYGDRAFLILCMGISLAGCILAFYQDKIKIEEHEKVQWLDIFELLKNKRYLNFLLFSVFIIGGNMVYNSFVSLYFTEIGGTLGMLGFATMLMTLTEIPFMWYSGKLIHKLGTKKLLIIGGVFFFIRWSSYYLFPVPDFFKNSFIIQGLTAGIFFSVAASHVKSIVSKKVLATATTIYMAAGTLGGTILQLLSGGIIDKFGVVFLQLFLAVTTLIFTFLFVKFEKKV